MIMLLQCINHCNVVVVRGSWLCCCSALTIVMLVTLLQCIDHGDIVASDDIVTW